jgi:F-type H+-transporting ATPase subunit b
MLIASSIFLVPNATLILEIIAFLIVLFVIGKYFLPPLNRMLSERQEEIRSSLATADLAREEAEQTRAQRQGILDEATGRAREIVAQANRTADRLKAEAEERGRREYERLVLSAGTEIALERQRAIDEVSAQVAGLVIAAARQVVGREIDAAAHRDLVEEAIAALRSGSPNAGANA